MTTSEPPAPRLLALDVDGTLTRPEGSIESELIEAINQVAERGVTVVLATGRGHARMRDLMRRLHASIYVVLNNGGLVRRIAGDRLVRATHLEPAAARLALERLRSAGLYAIWVESPYAGDRYLVDGAWWTDRATRTYLEPARPAVRPLLDPGSTLAPVQLFAFADPETIATAEAGLRAALDGRVSTVSWWSDRLRSSAVEVLPQNVTKGEAVAWLASQLDITPDRAIAVGDDRNDIELLQWAGRGIAIEGAPQDVVAAADEVMVHDAQAAVRRLIYEVWRI